MNRLSVIFSLALALSTTSAFAAGENSGAYLRGMENGQSANDSSYGIGYAQGLMRGQSGIAPAYNEGFLNGYGVATGMTPGPVSVPFGSLYTGGLMGGGGSYRSPFPMQRR